ELRETPSSEPAQRTEWNVRDSDVTLIIGSDVEPGGSEVSSGTTLTRGLASFHGRPVRAVGRGDIEDACGWLQCQGTGLTVNIAGPRESEWPGAYEAAFRIVGELLRRSSGPPSATR
ncbi:MAG: YpsA SLOG family protein, partial [Corynebacterium variabile]